MATCKTCNGTGISWTSASGEQFECSDCEKGQDLRRDYERSARARREVEFQKKHGYPSIYDSGTMRNWRDRM